MRECFTHDGVLEVLTLIGMANDAGFATDIITVCLCG
jgi:hypothetical protein